MNRDRPATMLTKREHAALAIYLADEDVDAIAAVHLADELFDVLDTPAELRDDDGIYYDQSTPNNLVLNHDALEELRKLAAELAEPRHD